MFGRLLKIPARTIDFLLNDLPGIVQLTTQHFNFVVVRLILLQPFATLPIKGFHEHFQAPRFCRHSLEFVGGLQNLLLRVRQPRLQLTLRILVFRDTAIGAFHFLRQPGNLAARENEFLFGNSQLFLGFAGFRVFLGTTLRDFAQLFLNFYDSGFYFRTFMTPAVAFGFERLKPGLTQNGLFGKRAIFRLDLLNNRPDVRLARR